MDIERLRSWPSARRPAVLTALATGALLVAAACAPAVAPTPAPPADTPAPPTNGDAEVAIVDNAFNPRSLEVAAGTTVVWTHTGVEPHTVTFDDGTDSGALSSGDTYQRTFDQPGTFDYVCIFHPGMDGSVIVE